MVELRQNAHRPKRAVAARGRRYIQFIWWIEYRFSYGTCRDDNIYLFRRNTCNPRHRVRPDDSASCSLSRGIQVSLENRQMVTTPVIPDVDVSMLLTDCTRLPLLLSTRVYYLLSIPEPKQTTREEASSRDITRKEGNVNYLCLMKTNGCFW